MTVKQVPAFCLSLRFGIDNFLLDLEISNRSNGTIQAQRIVLGFMADFADETQWPSLQDITKAHLRQYLAVLKSRPRWFGKRESAQTPISDSYYETHYRRIKGFFNWCIVEGYIGQNPLADIPHPKVSQRVIATVSDQNFQKLLKLTDPNLFRSPARRFRDCRDQAALWLLMDAPGRRREITRLTVDNVDLRDRRVLVEGKGRKERYIYIGAVTTKAMGRYKMLRDAVEPWTDDWWVDAPGKPMGNNWLYLMLQRLSARAGFLALHPHQFRHTFSINTIEADVPLPTLEVMGGWSRIRQTYLGNPGNPGNPGRPGSQGRPPPGISGGPAGRSEVNEGGGRGDCSVPGG